MTALFSPFTLRNTTFKNRLMLSSMCMYSAEDGFAKNFHLVHLGSRATGNFGLIMQEFTAVSPEGRITYKDLGLWKDEQKEKLRQIVDFVHAQGSKIGIQLAHAGRKASHRPPTEKREEIKPNEPNGWQTIAPSAIRFRAGENLPQEMDSNDIEQLKEDFYAAARRAKEIGYDVLELHAAHGYLFHQFYSPLSNQRTDQYGGSFDNRVRILIEIAEETRKIWGEEKPLFVRISATDWKETGGWTGEDSVRLSKKLKVTGVDLIDTSTGGNTPGAEVHIPVGPLYQTPFAEQVKKGAQIPTAAVGMITTFEQAEGILKERKADLIVLGREALRDPYFPLHVQHENGIKPDWPVQYEWAIG